MTNAEYNDFAKKVLDDILSDDNPNTQSTDITNIGEIFALKIIEGIANLDENTFPHRGADKVNNEFISLINNTKNNNNSNECIGNLPISDTTIIFINYSLFLGIRLAINTHSDPEYMLQRLGIEDARSLISIVNNVENIDNAKESFNLILEIYDYLHSFINDDELIRLSLWGIISFYGSSIIKACKSESLEDVFYLFKDVKYITEKYHSIYKERIIIIHNTAKLLFNEEYNVEEIFPQHIIDFIINYSTKIKSIKDLEDIISEDFDDKYNSIVLDLFFILYYFIYEVPKSIVKLGFYLMSDMLSSNINRAITPSFQKQDYAELIQYEYEWWCKETGERLSLPFPFFEGQLDLSKINIVDYDLNKKKTPLQIIVKDDNLSYIDSESSDKDTEQHFGLALKSNQVEYLYNELKGTYLDASTDIRLFCYRLTGKGKPDKIEKLKWVSDDDSLAVFIKHLRVSKNKCWQKTESFFGNKNENLKSRYHRLTKQKGKLKVNDINLTNLDNILASIKTNA